MTAILIDGTEAAAAVRADVRERVQRLEATGGRPHLTAIRSGDHPGSALFVRSQARACQADGIRFSEAVLPDGADTASALARLEALNGDPAVTGILLVKPFGDAVDFAALRAGVDPHKDVEGVHPRNAAVADAPGTALHPCTAVAAMELVLTTGFAFQGRHVVVVGTGETVGTPLVLLALQRWATVTACHIYTEDLASHTLRADCLFVAAGHPRLVTGDMVKPGAVVVDIGINRVEETTPDGKTRSVTVGDVDLATVAAVASHVTPVPGGVGPMTVAVLLRNTVTAAERLHAAR